MNTARMKKTLFFLCLFSLLTGLVSIKSYAQEADTCPAIYGGGLVCQEANDFRVDKKVQTPKDGSYVDRIPEDETKVAPNRTMIFRIQVTNTTDKTLRNIRVTDTLPNFVQFVKSDTEDVKQDKQKVSYTIKEIAAKKTNTVNIEGKILAKDKLPNTSPLCVANQVEARSGFSQSAKDFVTFCIDKNSSNDTAVAAPTAIPTKQPSFSSIAAKGGLKVASPTPKVSPKPTGPLLTKGGEKVFPPPQAATNPNTGPEVFALVALLPAGALGFYLRRKTG